jgi:hypothetical protein
MNITSKFYTGAYMQNEKYFLQKAAAAASLM